MYKSDDQKGLLHPKSQLKISGKKTPTISEKFYRQERGQNNIFKKEKKKERNNNNFNKTLYLVEIKIVFFVVSCSHWSVLICKHIEYVFSF